MDNIVRFKLLKFLEQEFKAGQLPPDEHKYDMASNLRSFGVKFSNDYTVDFSQSGYSSWGAYCIKTSYYSARFIPN